MVLVKAVATSPDKGPNDVAAEVTELLQAKTQELKTFAQVGRGAAAAAAAAAAALLLRKC